MVLILSVFIGIALDFAGAKPADPAVKYYASKYDHIDVEAILNNRRLVNYYSACLLSKGPCPPEGVELKRILPEALLSNCGRCTEKQATVAFRAIKRLRKEYPKIWKQLADKWDPDETDVKRFESTINLRHGKPFIQQPAVLSINEDSDRERITNNIGGNFFPATSTSHQNPTTVLTSTNSILQSSTISTNTNTITDYPYIAYEPTSFVSTTKTTTKPSSTTTPIAVILFSRFGPTSNSVTDFSISISSTTTRPSTTTSSRIRTTNRPQITPNLIPINTFFTNPPMPVRPLINLNLGANLGATVSGLVRSLGALGTRFMETGADIAEVVIKNFARPFNV